jgi:hypothetical protein
MHLRFAKVLFQRLMPSFESRTMRLNGHARFLLMLVTGARYAAYLSLTLHRFAAPARRRVLIDGPV